MIVNVYQLLFYLLLLPQHPHWLFYVVGQQKEVAVTSHHFRERTSPGRGSGIFIHGLTQLHKQFHIIVLLWETLGRSLMFNNSWWRKVLKLTYFTETIYFVYFCVVLCFVIAFTPTWLTLCATKVSLYWSLTPRKRV